MHKAFPLPVIEFPLPEEVPTASEESCHCQKKREATAVKIALLLKSKRNCQSKSDDSYTKAPRSQERGRRDNYRQGSKVKERASKALMAIDGVGLGWSYMANDEENHALVADKEAPTEFALMANICVESKVFDNSLCSKDCKKNTDSLNRDFLSFSALSILLLVGLCRPTIVSYSIILKLRETNPRHILLGRRIDLSRKRRNSTSTEFNEFSSNIATALVCLATNRVYNFSKMIFDGMVRNVNNKVSKILMYPRFLSKCLKMGQFGEITYTHTYAVPFHTRKIFTTLRINSPSFSGRTVPLFPSMLVTMDEGSGTLTEPHHTSSLEAQQTSPTATSSPSLPPSSALLTVADEPASLIGDDSQGEACATVSSLEAKQDRANIIKTSTLPNDSTPRVTSLAADEGNMQHKLTELMDLCTRLQRQQDEMALKITARDLEISALKARIKHLEDRDGGDDDPSGENATIKGMRLETGEDPGIERSIKKDSNDTEEMANILTSLDTSSVLTSVVQVSVPPATEVATVSIPPAGEIPTISVPTGSGMVPTASLIFTTTTESIPYIRRKGKEKMVESDTPKKKKLQEHIDVQVARELEKELARDAQRMNEQIARDAEIARIHAEEELQMMIHGLDRNNATVAKYLQNYEQFVSELSIGRRIEFINDLVKYQDNYAKVLKHFKGMSLEEIREKFDLVWKQIQDFIPMSSKEEGESFKRKGLSLEQESAKKVKTSEEVSEEDLKEMMQLVPVEEVYVEALQVKHLIIDWEIQTEGQRSYWKIIRLGGSTVSYQFFVDMLKHFDREDLNQLWALVKETLNIRQAASDKEKELCVELKRLYEPDVEDQLWTHTQTLMHDPIEWRLYDSCGVHHVLSRDQEIFMLVEREYPLRKGLTIVMISNKLQVENYSQMATEPIQKIYKIANSPRQRSD
nr:hypothetical protein [Tanacetum cinerariifolium]